MNTGVSYLAFLVGNVSPDWGWETIKLAGRDGIAGCLGGQDIAHYYTDNTDHRSLENNRSFPSFPFRVTRVSKLCWLLL